MDGEKQELSRPPDKVKDTTSEAKEISEDSGNTVAVENMEVEQPTFETYKVNKLIRDLAAIMSEIFLLKKFIKRTKFYHFMSN